MRINKITLQNFRNIETKKTFQLNPQFTVVIGINGKGKSTILHALRIACGAFFLNIPDVGKLHISQNEIRQKDYGKHIAPQKPVLVEAEGVFPESPTPITWRRQILETSNTNTSSENDVGSIRNIGKLKYQEITNGDDKVGLPIIAFFGTSRVHGAGRGSNYRNKDYTGRVIFKEGYNHWEEMQSSTYLYKKWLNTYDIFLEDKKEYPNTKKAFLDTIKKANRYIKEIKDLNGELWLKVDIEGNVSGYLPLYLHSDGIIMFTELVAELAYRCIVLNGYLDSKAIEESKGVVMIDELDMHLHPNWQRHIVKDLKNAFPNIQFVVTTHSLFIVQSLNSDELINLDTTTDLSFKEMKIDEVATDVMGVDSPYSEENQHKYDVTKELLGIIDTETDIQKLEEQINNVSAPDLRAFLELYKMSKGK